jgi:hypothetical protein
LTKWLTDFAIQDFFCSMLVARGLQRLASLCRVFRSSAFLIERGREKRLVQFFAGRMS